MCTCASPNQGLRVTLKSAQGSRFSVRFHGPGGFGLTSGVGSTAGVGDGAGREAVLPQAPSSTATANQTMSRPCIGFGRNMSIAFPLRQPSRDSDNDYSLFGNGCHDSGRLVKRPSRVRSNQPVSPGGFPGCSARTLPPSGIRRSSKMTIGRASKCQEIRERMLDSIALKIRGVGIDRVRRFARSGPTRSGIPRVRGRTAKALIARRAQAESTRLRPALLAPLAFGWTWPVASSPAGCVRAAVPAARRPGREGPCPLYVSRSCSSGHRCRG